MKMLWHIKKTSACVFHVFEQNIDFVRILFLYEKIYFVSDDTKSTVKIKR